jgi:hypothetical protein
MKQFQIKTLHCGFVEKNHETAMSWKLGFRAIPNHGNLFSVPVNSLGVAHAGINPPVSRLGGACS